MNGVLRHAQCERFFCSTYMCAIPKCFTMPPIVTLEDFKVAQKDLLDAKNMEELKAAFKKWRKIGGRTYANSGSRKEAHDG